MSQHAVFAAFLAQRLNAKGMSVNDLAKELCPKAALKLRRWFEGSSLPSAKELYPLSRALDADQVVLSVGWLIAQAPELTDVMDEEVLVGRQQKLPGF